ncbi:MAG: DUF1513 domain-containing protein [Pseudomonadota bacterium]
MPVAMNRRAILGAFAGGITALGTPIELSARQRARAVFATAFMTRNATFGVALLSEDGTVIGEHPLPARGHDVVFQPASGNLAVVFARRPGNFALAFSLQSRASKEPVLFTTPPNRHFYGHGVFSADGRLLFATENDFESGQGIIGIYDVRSGFSRVGEFASGGVGPHDVQLMPDGRHLLVANGGIETHPDYGRAKLNLATMQPNLALIEMSTGDLKARFMLQPSLSKISMRHLAGEDRRFWIAGQHEGDPAAPVPLLFSWSEDDGLKELSLPRNHLRSLRGYVGSVAYNPATNELYASSPEGGTLLVIDTTSGKVKKTIASLLVCGVAPSGPSHLATSRDGEVIAGAHRHTSSQLWDNHIAYVGA